MLGNLASRLALCVLAILPISLLASATSLAQQPSAVVARATISLKQGTKTVTVALAGDVLTAVRSEADRVLVQTAKGHKAWVRSAAIIGFKDAAPVYDNLIRGNPRKAEYYVLRGNVWAAGGEASRAIADYGRAIQLGRNDPDVYMSRGVFLASDGRFDEALADYALAIRAGASGKPILMNRAAAYLGKRDFDRAIKDYTRVIKLDPSNPNSYVERGIARRAKKDWDQAIADFSKALELDGNNLAAVGQRGFAHYAKGEHAAAVKDFSRAIELSPQDAVAYNNRGYNRQMVGDYRGALEDYEKAIRFSESKYALAIQNKAWLLATCPDKAFRNGQAALIAAKNVCELREYKVYSDIKALAAAHAELGNFDEAVRQQAKVVEKATGDQKNSEQEILKLYQSRQPFRLVASNP